MSKDAPDCIKVGCTPANRMRGDVCDPRTPLRNLLAPAGSLYAERCLRCCGCKCLASVETALRDTLISRTLLHMIRQPRPLPAGQEALTACELHLASNPHRTLWA